MMECNWIHEDARSVMGSTKNLGLVCWRDAPLAEDVRRWRSLAHALGRAHPEGAACLNVVVSGTPSFSNEMRRESEQFASDPKVFSLGIAHLVELGGLAGVTVRAFISTILLVARPAAPAKVFGDPRIASAWLTPKLSGWSDEQVFGAYQALATKRADVK